jgi:very-short-patch-repair endonuclease
LWELLPRYAGPVHVTVPHTRKPRPGHRIAVHRSRTLTDREIVLRNRIPVTTPARTLRDLRAVLPREEWEAAADRARARGLPVTDLVDEAPTRSALERRFLQLCRRHRIPAPRVNVRVGSFVVDFLWEESQLIVEVDGYEFHGGRISFEADRARDAELTLHGFRVLRFTYGQVTGEPERIASTVRQLLP